MQVSRQFGNFSINLAYRTHRISQAMQIVTQKTYILITTNPLGRWSLYDVAFKCVHPAREEDDGPTSLCFKRRRWWAHFTVLGAFKFVHPAREEDDGPTSLCLEPSSDHVICGPMRGLKKRHGEGTWWTSSATRRTLRLLDRIGPVGRFSENLVGFWWKC